MVRRRKAPLFAAPTAGSMVVDTFDRAFVAYQRELEDPCHTTLSLMGAVARVLFPPVAVTQDAVDGIDFLIRHDVDSALVVFAIVRELDRFRTERGDGIGADTGATAAGWTDVDNLVHRVRLPRGSG